VTYLITISFILHFISFFIIILLIQKLNVKNTMGQANEQEKLKREIEDLLVAYTTEMKEENEKLVNKIVIKRNKFKEEQSNTFTSSENQKTNPSAPLVKKPSRNKPEVEEDFLPPIIDEYEDIVEQSSTAQVLSLANQGFTAKEIAKRLSMGAGEVELLLKFHK
jgi:hypothetical protein